MSGDHHRPSSGPECALDDVEAQARLAWRLGGTLCRTCAGYHRIWGLLRLASVVGGTKVDEDVLPPLIDAAVRPGDRVLIAGSADAGLLELLARSARARPLDITIVDRCPAPLALIDHLALPPGLHVATRQADLTSFAPSTDYDLIVSHSMLPLVEPTRRPTFLQGMRAALSRRGTLLLVVRTSPPPSASAIEDHDNAWLAHAGRKLAARPDLAAFAGAELAPALRAYARSRRDRFAAFSDPADIGKLLRNAGFLVRAQIVGGPSTRLTMGGQMIGKESHVFVAVPAE